MGWKVCLRQNIAGHCQQTFIFNEDEGDAIEFRLPFKIFSTLKSKLIANHKIAIKIQ